MDKKTYDLLLRSLDTDLDEHDKLYLNNALGRSDELVACQKRLQLLRDKLSLSQADCLAPQFSDLVMQVIRMRAKRGPETLMSTLLTAFRPLALGSALVIALLAGFNAYYTVSAHQRQGLDEVLAMIQDAHSLSLEDQLCVQK